MQHLWQVLFHLFCKDDAIVAFSDVVQLLKEAGSPLVQQAHHICADAWEAPQKDSKLPAAPKVTSTKSSDAKQDQC